MADYGKLKVNELKEELKARGIPLTGLKLKQNFIDKLVDADASGQTNNASGAVAASGSVIEDEEAKKQNSSRDSQNAESRDGNGTLDYDVTSTQPAPEDTSSLAKEEAELNPPGSVNGERGTPLDRTVAAQPQSSADKAPEESTKEPVSRNGTTEEPALQSVGPTVTENDEMAESAAIPAVDSSGTLDQPAQIIESPPASTIHAAASATSTPASIQVPVKELIEDSKKRKRRSATPPPSEADIAQKRAKASDGSPRITKSPNLRGEKEDNAASESAVEKVINDNKPELSTLEQPEATTGAADVSREADGSPAGEQSETVGATSTKLLNAEKTEDLTLQPLPESAQSPEKQSVRNRPGGALFGGLKRLDPDLPQETPSSKHSEVGGNTVTSSLTDRENEERAVAPALHPATSSLYLRNFKRPLHLPSLRAHIAKIAQGSTSSNVDEDPIVAYFLDNIRTHALVSFRSVTAASRVRSALHETRYPDEKTRDPLWVDFIPDDKVMSWIDIETTGGGGRGAAPRWEVVYEERPGGIEAVLQEVGSGAGSRRPSTASQRQPSMAGVQRQPSISNSHPAPVALVHPDRVPLVPQSRTHVVDSPRETQHRVSQPERPGTGFRALDELFSFTTAKPKLYYKPVSEQVADRRMNAIKDLRVGHTNMGKSGDEDMKRYSFEMYRGEEEWVDKGPEFGYGRRGVERMRGGAPVRGGYRGGGGGGGGYRGGGFGYRDRERDDVWRGARR